MAEVDRRCLLVSAEGICLVFVLQCVLLRCSSCPTSTQYYAVHSKASIFVRGLSQNNMDCSFNIARGNGFGEDYFLELKWIDLTVPDKMPSCEESYIEVFLTRSYNSLGRICTSNIVNTWYVFTMYSYDGNAEIKYHVGKEAQNFKFHLQIKLRSRKTEYLGSGVKCYNARLTRGSGNLFSSGWPRRGYNFSSPPCTHEIEPNSVSETRLYFMDISLKRQFSGCDSNDILVIKGAENHESYEKSTTIRKAICGDKSLLTLTVQHTKVYVRFIRHIRGKNYNARGFVAGYLSYEIEESSMKSVMIALVVCLFVVLAMLIAACCWYRVIRIRRRRHQSAVPSNEDATLRVTQEPGNNNGEESCVAYVFALPPYSAEDPFPRSQDHLPPPYNETNLNETQSTEN